MAINFPNSPSTNDTHTASGKTWKYDGTSWNLLISSTSVGDKGQKGEVGDKGIDGSAANKGDDGDKGEVGDKGQKGQTGAGDKGDKGESGADSTVPGQKGDAGDKGDKGDQNAKGQKGEDGGSASKGDKGDKGETGADSTVPGDKGQKGQTGAGDKGEVGDKGQKGQTGAGDKGDKGESGGSGSSQTFTVTNSGASAYLIDGTSNASITLERGSTYNFNLSVSGHPFWIKTSASTGTGNAYSTGVTNNGAQSGTLTFVVPSNAPNTLYYICQYHGGMVGTITVTDPVFDGNITGNAATATALQTARTISGVSFDGTSNITIPDIGALDFVNEQRILGSSSASYIEFNDTILEDNKDYFMHGHFKYGTGSGPQLRIDTEVYELNNQTTYTYGSTSYARMFTKSYGNTGNTNQSTSYWYVYDGGYNTQQLYFNAWFSTLNRPRLMWFSNGLDNPRHMVSANGSWDNIAGGFDYGNSTRIKKIRFGTTNGYGFIAPSHVRLYKYIHGGFYS